MREREIDFDEHLKYLESLPGGQVFFLPRTEYIKHFVRRIRHDIYHGEHRNTLIVAERRSEAENKRIQKEIGRVVKQVEQEADSPLYHQLHCIFYYTDQYNWLLENYDKDEKTEEVSQQTEGTAEETEAGPSTNRRNRD